MRARRSRQLALFLAWIIGCWSTWLPWQLARAGALSAAPVPCAQMDGTESAPSGCCCSEDCSASACPFLLTAWLPADDWRMAWRPTQSGFAHADFAGVSIEPSPPKRPPIAI